MRMDRQRQHKQQTTAPNWRTPIEDGPTTPTGATAWTTSTHPRSATPTTLEALFPILPYAPLYYSKKTHFCLASILPIVNPSKRNHSTQLSQTQETPSQADSLFSLGGRKQSDIRWRRPHHRDWRTTVDDHPTASTRKERASHH